ncbi:MAG: hypothetical protein ACI4EN_10175 [Butyrivibrio sp.]
MINPAAIMKLKKGWDTFTANHPKFPAFMQAASQGMVTEDSIIDVTITAPDGRRISTNVKITQSDLELFESFKGMAK